MKVEATYRIKNAAKDTILHGTISNLVNRATDSPDDAIELMADIMHRIDNLATEAYLLGREGTTND